jgi:hypothetical protein
MNPISFQQEILLLTGTSFSSRQCCEKDEKGNANPLTEAEQLENAMWNGLLPELLPEIMEQRANNNPVYLWEIREAASFIELELGQQRSEREKHFSVNPYLFLHTQHYN